MDNNHVTITLDDLNWPKEIQDDMNNLKVAARATFVLYCIGIGLALVQELIKLHKGQLASDRTSCRFGGKHRFDVARDRLTRRFVRAFGFDQLPDEIFRNGFDD